MIEGKRKKGAKEGKEEKKRKKKRKREFEFFRCAVTGASGGKNVL